MVRLMDFMGALMVFLILIFYQNSTPCKLIPTTFFGLDPSEGLSFGKASTMIT